MINYTINKLEYSLKLTTSIVAIHGAGIRGNQVLYALSKRGISVDYFVDSDEKKQNRLHSKVKTLSTKKFSELAPNGHLFIAHDYIIPIAQQLRKLIFKNYYNTIDLLENTDFSDGNEYTKMYPNETPIKIERNLKTHKFSVDKAVRVLDKLKSDRLTVKHIDIVITERCSLKCKDCANLMQYYERPQNSDLNILFKSLDRMMKSVDIIYECRVLGGDPFMNKEMYKVVNRLVKYQNVEQIVIYTNAKILPKGDNLQCLKDKKVRLEIAVNN